MHQLKNNRTGELGIPKTEVECFYNDDILVFNFVAHDSSLISFSDKDNDELWRGNVVEIFLDVGEQDYYYEFEVAPNGTTFVAQKHINKLVFVNNNFFKANTKKSGDSYFVRMEIDVKKISKTNELLFNAFRCEGEVIEALNPTLCDTFHKKDKFIPVKNFLD